MADLTNLRDAILSVDLNVMSINDISLVSKDEKYHIDYLKLKEGEKEAKPALISENGIKKYGTSKFQLAALRIAGAPTSDIYTETFKWNPSTSTLQAYILSHMDQNIADLRFGIIQQLRIRNLFTTKETPLYKPICYEGSQEYAEERSRIFALAAKDPAYASSRQFSFEISNASNALHKTALIKGMDKDENLILIPVFKILS